MEAMNAAWQAAAGEMYQATGGAQPGADAGAAGSDASSGSSSSGSSNDVSDVEYEEVNDKDKKS
jgi:molecular chaperone DnaK